jgi:hypothetical protein
MWQRKKIQEVLPRANWRLGLQAQFSMLDKPAALPVGWEHIAAPAGWQEPRKRAGKTGSDTKNAEPMV